MGTFSTTLTVGIALSLALGYVAFLIDSRAGRSGAKTLGLLVTLVGILLSGLLDHHNRTRTSLERAIPLVETDSLRIILDDIAELDKSLRSGGARKIQELVLKPVILKLSKNVEEASSGRVVQESKEATMSLAKSLIPEAKKRLWTTSYIDPEVWGWGGNAGDEYRESTKRTVSSDVDFVRVFIVDTDLERRVLQAEMEAQVRDDIEVRWVLSSDLTPDLRRDFLVIDTVLAAEIVLAQGRQFQEGHFFPSEAIAKDYSERFKQIRALSTEVEVEQGGAGES